MFHHLKNIDYRYSVVDTNGKGEKSLERGKKFKEEERFGEQERMGDRKAGQRVKVGGIGEKGGETTVGKDEKCGEKLGGVYAHFSSHM